MKDARRPAIRLMGEMFRPPHLRSTMVLVSSAACLAAWQFVGQYPFWLQRAGGATSQAAEDVSAAVGWALASSVLLLGVVPAAIVKLVLRERLADYGVRRGDARFAVVCCVLATPLIVAIGYLSAQSPAFQAIYPADPAARQSWAALAWYVATQVLFYTAWEFHFRGFLQHGLSQAAGLHAAIWIQTLVSTLAHFDKPPAEVFGAIIAGFLWGLLAFRTRSLAASTFQHWLLGASLDFFVLCGR
jgi:membrane protease YdiL (CAAX protease family)